MKKIGILTCLKSNNVCTRAGCLKAFHNRTDFFAEYPEDTELAVVMTCNGCESFNNNTLNPKEDPGIQQKIERLVKEEIEVMHVGVCQLRDKVECSKMFEIYDMIEEKGIKVIKGTHKE